jgi:hypothetical protein
LKDIYRRENRLMQYIHILCRKWSPYCGAYLE